MVRRMRGSKAPATMASFPLREQLVTATRLASMLVACGPSCSSASMMRLTPQAQATRPPVVTVLPYRS